MSGRKPLLGILDIPPRSRTARGDATKKAAVATAALEGFEVDLTGTGTTRRSSFPEQTGPWSKIPDPISSGIGCNRLPVSGQPGPSVERKPVERA